MDRSGDQKKYGFTLVEVMVALTIVTMALGVIIPFIIFTFKAALLNETNNTLFAKTRYAYERMQHDAAQAQLVFGVRLNGDSIALDQQDQRLDSGENTDIIAFVNTVMGFERGSASALTTPVAMADCLQKIVFYYLIPIPEAPEFYQLYRFEQSVDPKTIANDSSGLPTNYSFSNIQNSGTLVLEKVSKVYTGGTAGAFCCIVKGKAIGASLIAYYNMWSMAGKQKPLLETNIILQTVFAPML